MCWQRDWGFFFQGVRGGGGKREGGREGETIVSEGGYLSIICLYFLGKDILCDGNNTRSNGMMVLVGG